jgi:CDP-diacylglycerol--serine O-phosphatidyltransferase
MNPPKLRRPLRPSMRRAVTVFPSGLTLLNLFFGIFAIITASRGDFYRAGVYVLLGGICDALDGRVARATNAGSQFGEELDSLVDAISFGLAPAMIMYFAVLDREGWQWVFVFAFSACAVLRLARFNIEQAGTAKTYFSGLPSPAAGCTLASYYWFSHSWMYNYGAIGNLPWQELLRFLMAALAALMFSPVPYPVFPRTGWRSKRALAGTVLLLVSGTLFLTNRLEYFFPLCLLYVAWGPLRWLISGLFERRQPTIPYDLSEGDDDEDDEEEEFEPATSQVHASRRESRPKRDEVTKRTLVSEEPAMRTSRPDERPPRADRPDRPERPKRTEAEIAARREKRDKRDKQEPREPREERAPKPPRPEELVVASTIPSPISEPESPASASIGDPMDNAGAGAEFGAVAEPGTAGEAAAPRKRKRRRRRGERNRAGADALGSQAGGTDADGADSDGDDGADYTENESASTNPSASERAATESPHSSAPRPEPMHATSVAPAPAPVPASVPPTVPAPASHAEPASSPMPTAESHE